MAELIGTWIPQKRDGVWLCQFKMNSTYTEHHAGKCYYNGKDAAPLRFWNEKSAQLKCDALNRRNTVPTKGNST